MYILGSLKLSIGLPAGASDAITIMQVLGGNLCSQLGSRQQKLVIRPFGGSQREGIQILRTRVLEELNLNCLVTKNNRNELGV
jgi:hypothetical protein